MRRTIIARIEKLEAKHTPADLPWRRYPRFLSEVEPDPTDLDPAFNWIIRRIIEPKGRV